MEEIGTPTGDSHCESEEETPRYGENVTKTLIEEARLRRKLQFFFMNPIQKWHAKRRFPFKFVVQLVKIILVTLQLCLYASSSYNHVNYTWDNKITFSHLFLKNWDATREVNSYPPAAGPLAIYKEQDFFQTLDYAYDGYVRVGEAIGSYSYANEDNTATDMVLCLYQYKQGTIFGFNESYVFNSEIVERCLNISRYENGVMLNSRHFLLENNINVSFSALVRGNLMFSLKTVNFKAASRITAPNCYRFDIAITFNNEDHDGQLLLDLNAEAFRLKCKGDITYITDDEISSLLCSLLNYTVTITCIISLVLCCRTVCRAQHLKWITMKFFDEKFGRPLSSEDKNKFLNYWYITIIINDILIIIGSSIKEQIERREFTSDQWSICSMFLGVGNMLVWFGILRYLGFFKTYNIVILTLQRAAPKIARFMLCALIMYGGFTFCGWLILGPYHIKFRTLSTTSECLFSLINGDDMFATFSIMSNKSQLLWWFSRIYLYSFICLYIYVILNLCISLITDTYETIKLYYRDGFPESELDKFTGFINCEEMSSGMFRRTESNDSLSLICLVKNWCCFPKLQKTYRTLSRNSFSPNSAPHSNEAT
ncbi:mucolipin-3 isoform X1 [Dendroctonus ponderosae]|uniref:Polycystin cation channel PKD1/PKD2 domain-containing protein n=2 Tax=Dendroctonus ponderosae TaxID=77166 RepID=A0AAR5P0A9_DENPD|nr:mucolipin-3 isoform X1 [Dendroctonus ponderosae]